MNSKFPAAEEPFEFTFSSPKQPPAQVHSAPTTTSASTTIAKNPAANNLNPIEKPAQVPKEQTKEINIQVTTKGKAKASNESNRIVCHFFNTPQGCKKGSSCRFAHQLTQEQTVIHQPCRFFAQGNCLRGSNCPFLHVEPCKDETIICGICLDHPTEFGLLIQCDHIFCLSCIRYFLHLF
jgi:hypothetical protein